MWLFGPRLNGVSFESPCRVPHDSLYTSLFYQLRHYFTSLEDFSTCLPPLPSSPFDFCYLSKRHTLLRGCPCCQSHSSWVFSTKVFNSISPHLHGGITLSQPRPHQKHPTYKLSQAKDFPSDQISGPIFI